MKVIVSEGTAWVHTQEDETRLPADTYGWDWIMVDASDLQDALEQAEMYDNRVHPAQTEMELFAAAYRAGLWGGDR